MFNKVGIVGLGLIGGSLAKAFKNRFNAKTVVVACNRNDDVLKTAHNEGVIDAYSTEIDDTFSDCDIVFICTPVDKIIYFAEQLSKTVSPSCIISDVGSTKEHIYDQMKAFSDKFIYIGGHPMTGSEKYRYNASKEHLFENAYYILTPAGNAPAEAIENLRNAVETFGAIPIIVSACEHDHIVASISHVPHIIAAALCNSVKNMDTPQKHMKTLAAGGFKDITRIASSSSDMWSGICSENKKEILSALENFENVISSIKNSIENNDTNSIREYFDNARIYRDSFANTTPRSFIKRYEIVIDVLDRPGSIAIIAVLFSSNNINIKNLSIVNSREHECGVLQISFDSEEDRAKSVKLLKDMNYEVYIKE